MNLQELELELHNSPALIKLRNLLRRIERIERKIKQIPKDNNGYEQIDTSQLKETSNPDVGV